MIFNVSTLLREPIGSRRSYRLTAEPFWNDDQEVPVTGTVELLRTDGSILARATGSLTISERCSDCLRSFPLPLTLRFEEEFWPEFDPLTFAPVVVPEDREGFPIVEGHLDVTEAVRQYVEIARPMRPLCGAQCRGLNWTGSPLPPDEPTGAGGDSRWAALRSLRSELDH